ncbi:MAG: hypothetical protein EAZ95_13350 [Bacteroidetes bacterium]|nr:MAG: hypothetical protein EAZ95_13350 [Bacteroidota bacterium]
MKKISIYLSALVFLGVVVFQACGGSGGGTSDDKGKPTDDKKEVAIKPIPLPATGSGGFKFPEDSATIYQWLDKRDTASIYKHAWGLWEGLTTQTDQVLAGDKLLVFETWKGIQELVDDVNADNKNGGCDQPKKSRTPLKFPKQLLHAKPASLKSDEESTTIDKNQNNFEGVAYNPEAACYATSNLIYKKSVLESYRKKDAIGTIPPFPQKSMTIKPVYFVGKQTDGLIRIPAWVGSNLKLDTLNQWNSVVYADVNNKSSNKNIQPVDTTTKDIKKATCDLNDFIHFKVDAAMAEQLKKEQPGADVKAGDIAILVAMHVTTKEISNWTWQTFFWVPNADAPASPSSKYAASLRPKSLSPAAAHYAVSTAYAMVWPNQPITGGINDKNKTEPIIGYNPYLEAGFGAFGNKNTFGFQYGIQTNCMSCHAIAYYNPTGDKAQNPFYTADQYIDMKDKIFVNKVQLDFAWSIKDNLLKNK